MVDGDSTRIGRLFSIFQRLTGESFDVNRYQHRLMLQKITYLIKAQDNSFDYAFSWFVRGPYSPQLAKDGYEHNVSEASELTETDLNNTEFIRNLVGTIDETNLELFASVYYLMTIRKITEFNELYFTLHSLKPWFEKAQVCAAFERISNPH